MYFRSGGTIRYPKKLVLPVPGESAAYAASGLKAFYQVNSGSIILAI